MLVLIETLVHVQQSHLCVSALWRQVQNGVFFKRCMGKALDNLEADDANKIDDPFELCNYYAIIKSVINHYDYIQYMLYFFQPIHHPFVPNV